MISGVSLPSCEFIILILVLLSLPTSSASTWPFLWFQVLLSISMSSDSTQLPKSLSVTDPSFLIIIRVLLTLLMSLDFKLSYEFRCYSAFRWIQVSFRLLMSSGVTQPSRELIILIQVLLNLPMSSGVTQPSYKFTFHSAFLWLQALLFLWVQVSFRLLMSLGFTQPLREFIILI